MDELEISGRRYISSARAAKEYKYHADYIGQLVRGGKVAGQKVGRAWYVDEVSLAEYLGKENAPAPKAAPKVVKKPVPVIEVIEAEVVDEANSSSDEDRPTHQNASSEEKEEAPDIFAKKFARRPHVIAPLAGDEPKPAKKEMPEVIEVAEIEVEEEQPEVNEPYAFETPEEDVTAPMLEEEVFIPVKVERVREPEDSFYKIPRKGLQYIASRPAAASRVDAPAVTRMDIAPAPAKPRSRYGMRVAVLASLIFIAGIVSLCGGVLLSYYLHSATVVSQNGQVSGLIFSQ